MKKEESMMQWFRQMAVLVAAGLPVVQALEVCARQTSDEQLAQASHELAREVRRGVPLAQAVERLGAPFTRLHVGALEAAQAHGDLGPVLRRLAGHAEKEAHLRRRVRGALAYPALVLSVSLLGLYLLVRFLTPLLEAVGQQLDLQTSANPFTQALLWLSWARNYELHLAVVLLLTLLLIRLFPRTLAPRWSLRREQMLLKLPAVGGLLQRGSLIRLCRTLESLVGSGLPLGESLKLAGISSGSLVVEHQVMGSAVKRLYQGESLAQSLSDQPFLPPSFHGLLLAGEMSGHLEDAFESLARIYEMEFDTRVESSLAALEPITIALVGLVVLGVLLGAFLPLYQLISVG